jgi:hypothetical protein
MRLLLTFLLFAATASAQWRLFLLEQGVERAVQDACDLGSVEIGGEIAATFRLRNTAGQTATLGSITVAGANFLPLEGSPPAALGAGGVFDFIVRFQPRSAGAFSAALLGPHGSAILRASATPALTIRNGSGVPLTRDGFLDFGIVEIGLQQSNRVIVENLTGITLSAPAAAVTGPDFTLRGTVPAELTPGQSASLEVIFTPTARGERTGILSVGSRRIPLRGYAVDPPLPPARLLADAAVRSAEQRLVRIRFDEPVRSAASGELFIESAASADNTLVFANGTRAAAFELKPGDQERSFAYQTGATAGVFRFRLRLGERTEEIAVQAAEEPVRITTASGARDSDSVSVRLTALDNTLTTSLLTYTFFDRSGNQIGRWSRDYAESFFNHFKSSQIGGTYSLFMRFPVTGDVAQVHSVQVEMTNRAGVAMTDPILF